MEIFIEIILKAGRSAVELALFVLLPVMVVMLSLMRLLEARGVLDWVVVRLAPLLKPFGLTGLGVFAALQINFVSFAAPLATLTMMLAYARDRLPGLPPAIQAANPHPPRVPRTASSAHCWPPPSRDSRRPPP